MTKWERYKPLFGIFIAFPLTLGLYFGVAYVVIFGLDKGLMGTLYTIDGSGKSQNQSWGQMAQEFWSLIGPSHAEAATLETATYQRTNYQASNSVVRQDDVRSEDIELERLAAAIRSVESTGNYRARNKKSGATGAYQFMPRTWKARSTATFGHPVPYNLSSMTPEVQDRVAKHYIQDLIDRGYSGGEIAKIWNGGTPTEKSGVNQTSGASYNTREYANKVLARY